MPGGEKNTYGLPDGEAIRTEMVAIFREQRIALLGWMDDNGYKAIGLPPSWPSWESLKLGAADIAARVREPIADIWRAAGSAWRARVGIDPPTFDVAAPPVPARIDAQATNLGAEVNATTGGILDRLLGKVRDLWNAGTITLRDAIARLRKGVAEELKPMEAWRARRIAVTEAARAYHEAMIAAAHASGVVTGWEWLLAEDPCPVCIAIQEGCPFARLDQPFAIIGTGSYSIIECPPVHPNCMCSLREVVLSDHQPDWGETVVDPATPTRTAVPA